MQMYWDPPYGAGKTERPSDRAQFMDRPLRIAQLAPLVESVPPARYGGTERVIHALTEELVRRGHDVTLFATGDSQTSARLESMAPHGIRGNARDSDALNVAMLEWVRRESSRFDVIHSHLGHIGFPFSRSFQSASVHTLHGRLDLPEHERVLNYYRDRNVVTISWSQRGFLPASLVPWAETVYNGIDFDRFAFRQQPDSPSYLAFLGRISPEKRPDRAISIARRAGIPLRIAAKIDPTDAEWADRHFLPLLDGPGVDYLGELDDKGRIDLLSGALALLFPIDWPEPFGLAMAESQACGTPVVAMVGGAVDELIAHGETGFVCHSEDDTVEAVSAVGGIERSRCRRRAEALFTASAMADGYEAVYQRALDRTRSVAQLPYGPSGWRGEQTDADEPTVPYPNEEYLKLFSSPDSESTLAQIIHLAVPRLADYCAIHLLIHDSGSRTSTLELTRTGMSGRMSVEWLSRRYDLSGDEHTPPVSAALTGRTMRITREISEISGSSGVGNVDPGIISAVHVPLIMNGETTGVLSLVLSDSDEQHCDVDLSAAEALAAWAAQAIEVARRHERLRAEVRDREEDLTIAAHELKAPLTAAKGYGQILCRRIRTRPDAIQPIVEQSDRIVANLERLETLMDDLFDVSLLRQGRIMLRPEPVELVGLAREVIGRFENPYGESPRYDLRLAAPDRLEGQWDSRRIEQVLGNLISNAVKYSPDGGTIDIRIEPEQDKVRLLVCDEGVGIAREDRQRLIERFQRGHSGSRAVHGAGLGLSIVKQIIEHHGGEVAISGRNGAGSLVSVTLPYLPIENTENPSPGTGAPSELGVGRPWPG